MMGLGDDITYGDGFSDNGTYLGTDTSNTNSTSYFGSDYNSQGQYIGPSSSSSSSGFNWNNAISSLSNNFSSILKAIQPLPSGCIQVAGPYGMSTQCGNTTSQPTLSLSSSLSSLGLSSTSLLLIGGVVVVIMMAKK